MNFLCLRSKKGQIIDLIPRHTSSITAFSSFFLTSTTFPDSVDFSSEDDFGMAKINNKINVIRKNDKKTLKFIEKACTSLWVVSGNLGTEKKRKNIHTCVSANVQVHNGMIYMCKDPMWTLISQHY